MEVESKNRQQFRLAFSTAMLAAALAYLAARQFFIERFGQFEIWLLVVIAVSAICSFIYLYLLAIEAKYYKSRLFRPSKPEDKQVFFDLSVDVFLLVPAFFVFYYVYAQLSDAMPADLGSSTWIAGTLTALLLLILIPLLLRFLVWSLTWLLYEIGRAHV